MVILIRSIVYSVEFEKNSNSFNVRQ